MRYLIIIAFFCSHGAIAQFGQYQALSLPSGARTAGLGGYQVSLADGDVVQFLQNPSLLDSVSPTSISLNYNPYFAGVNVFSGAYLADFSGLGALAFGLTYLNYGEFTERDASGDELGTFHGGDLMMVVGKSHTVGLFTLGVNLKFTQSSIAGYGASALAFDIGGLYRSPRNPFTIGMVFKNLGFPVSSYTMTKTPLPFDVQIGTSVKPAHMPFRFTVTAYNLVRQNLLFESESDVVQAKALSIFDQIISRLNFGTELILSENVQFLFGYNHLRRNELKLETTGGGAGFTYGLMIGIKRFQLRYSRATYNSAGGANFIGIQTNFQTFNSIL